MSCSTNNASPYAEKNRKSALARWKCILGHILEINWELTLAGEPEVMCPFYNDNGIWSYDCTVRMNVPEGYEFETVKVH